MNGVEDTDILARHAVEKNHFRPSNMTVKKKAFQPAKNGTVSTFVVTEMEDEQIMNLGNEHVAVPRNKPLYGWSVIKASIVRELGLCADRNDEPPGHANIVGWPEAEEDILELQLELASEASFVPVT
jgi:hypothetical protein